jgi:hypothetical protein
MPVTQSRWFRSAAKMCAIFFVWGCGGPAPLTVDMPLHLEEHLDVATIEDRASLRRPVPLLLYDLWNDPRCLHSRHEERPDLVEKYTAFLEGQFEAHQALAQRFTPGERVELTPE